MRISYWSSDVGSSDLPRIERRTMMREDLEQQLEALLDKQAISELVHAYCNAADRHDFDKMRALYHDDAIDEHGKFAKGPASEFLNKLPEIQAPMAVLHHNVTTINLKDRKSTRMN